MRRMFTLGSLLPIVALTAHAQSRGDMPPGAAQLVVQVLSYGQGELEPGAVGAGIVMTTSDRIVIATAAHVIRGAMAGGRVRVVFYLNRADSIDAAIDQVDPELDLAVLSVPARAASSSQFDLDRAGDPMALKTGDPVIPMGCPNGVCWEPPVSPDRLIGVHERGIVFESFAISPGSSGGALFNQHWEIVGMVVEKADPQGRALTFRQMRDRMKAWEAPVQLHQKPIPRAGYATRVSVVGLTAPSDPVYESGRWPGGRLAVLLNGQRRLGWHLTGLRLAPEDVTVSAGMVGLDFRLQKGPFALIPFGEVGLGRVEERYDVEGYWISTPSGPVYQPYWNQAQNDVIGFGAGASLEVIVFPHVALEVLGGHWSFQTDHVQSFPDFFVGGGLRFGF